MRVARCAGLALLTVLCLACTQTRGVSVGSVAPESSADDAVDAGVPDAGMLAAPDAGRKPDASAHDDDDDDDRDEDDFLRELSEP